MGIGSIPDAVMGELYHHKDLGVHTEMFSDGVVNLCKAGVITNKYKKKHRRKVITTFVAGSKMPVSYTHLDVYKRQDRTIAFSLVFIENGRPSYE